MKVQGSKAKWYESSETKSGFNPIILNLFLPLNNFEFDTFKSRGVHHIPFPGVPSCSRENGTGNFLSRTKAENFPGAGNGKGSGICPGNPVPVPDFNIVSFLKFLNKK